MWIVRLALRRPYTFIVLALLIVLLGVFTILRTPTDIFPAINIPVVSTIWSYVGLPPEDMANRIVSNAERYAQTTVNDVEHTESQSLPGMSVVKYFFQPNVNEDLNPEMLEGLKLHYVKTIQEVVEKGLEKDPVTVETGRLVREVALTPAAAGTPN